MILAVLADICIVTTVGLLLGLAGGIGLARFVHAILYEVTPYE